MKRKICFLLLSAALVATGTRAQDYNILKYGAVSDTTKLSTTAINQAVTACFKNGGGRVVIPAGNFKSGTIILKDNVEIHLSPGSTLYASTDPADIPRQQQPAYRSQKDPGGWFSLVYAENAVNIGISGSGTIDGQGARQKGRPGLLDGDRDGRPRNILLISCKKVKVEGITMLNSGVWNQHYLNCEDVMVDHVNVFNHSNQNNDGIDIDGCRRFVLTNSIFDSDDDGICLKSTGPAGCENVTISNCIVSSMCNAIKCGTESTGGFKNIVISNCVVKPSASKFPSVFGHPLHGIGGIALETVDGGIMEGIIVNNIVIEGTECPIYVRLGTRGRKYKEDAPEPTAGQIKNIRISNITAYHTGNFSCSITGVPLASIESISLDHIRLINTGGVKVGAYPADHTKVKENEKGYPDAQSWKELPSYGFFIRHVKNIDMADISLGSAQQETRSPLIGVDIQSLTLKNFTVDGKISPAILLVDVRNPNIDTQNLTLVKP